MLALALVLGLLTALANLAGAYLAVIQKSPSRGFIVASLGFGGGFLLAAALLEVLPESLGSGPTAPLFAIAGYGVIFIAEQLFAGHAHEVPGRGHVLLEETHSAPEHMLAQEFRHRAVPITAHASLAALVGFNIHDFIDGLAIGAGMVTSQALGMLMFIAVLLHEVPAGFVLASVMRGAGHGRRAALLAGASIGVITLVGILVPFLVSDVNETLTGVFLALSAGSFIYIAATDLIPAAAAWSRRAYLFVLLGAAVFYASGRLLGAVG